MKNKALFKFNNFSKKQKMVLSWWCEGSPYKDKDGIICDGSIRAGKTTAMAFSFVMWGMDQFTDQNFALCGKTINSLRRNVLKQLKAILISRGYGVTEHRAENYLTISMGQKKNDFYLFGGKDEASQDLIQGITLAGVFFDEVALMPESFVNQAVGRCSVEGSKFWFNCNPDSPAHWFKEKWIDHLSDKNVIRIHFTMDDNPSLSEATKRRYRSLFVGVFFDRFIRGLWVMAEGLIFPMYKESLVEAIPENQQCEQQIISIDYGTMNAFAAIRWSKHGNIWYGDKGYYYSGREEGITKTDEEYLQELEETFEDTIEDYRNRFRNAKSFNNVLPERVRVIIDPSAASFIALLKKRDWCKVIKARNDVKEGLTHTASALQLGIIKIVNNKSMKPWKKEAGGYIWDEKAEKHGDEKPVKVNDHYMDATRYFVETTRLVKPVRNMEEAM